MLEHTERFLVRCYPAGMRIDSSNFNPITMWSVGIQMVALNYQTRDFNMVLNTTFFSQNKRSGYVLKPSVMWNPDHILYKRFTPFSKELIGLHSTTIELTIISGQYVCEHDYSASPIVEVEVLGIPKDCYKYKTKMSQRNALNPIWEDTFEIEVRLAELAFLRFTVVDIATSVSTAQRIIPLKQLRQGYRNVPLWDMKGKPLPLSSLFILSVFHPDSVLREDSPSAESLQRKRMSFLLIHDVGEQDPYAILKVTSESTAQDVIKMALEKVGKTSKVNEFVLLEEVGKDNDNHQRLVGMEEIPLSVRSQWQAEGKFVLKRVGEDPSWRARLGTNMIHPRDRRISTMFPKSEFKLEDVEEEPDMFLVCIFNVSPGVAHTILRVSKSNTATQVIVQALMKSRSIEDPRSYVLVEETEIPDGKKKVGKKLVQRVLADDENVYLVQSSWKGVGKLTLLERDKNVLRNRGLETHQNIRETQSEPLFRGSPRLRRPNNLVGRVRKFSRSLYGHEGMDAHETVSDNDLSDDDDDSNGRKSSIANFRKLKIW